MIKMEKTIEKLKEFYEDEVIDAGVFILTKLSDNEEEIDEMLKLSYRYSDLVEDEEA